VKNNLQEDEFKLKNSKRKQHQHFLRNQIIQNQQKKSNMRSIEREEDKKFVMGIKNENEFQH
jgi:hypothetical protein